MDELNSSVNKIFNSLNKDFCVCTNCGRLYSQKKYQQITKECMGISRLVHLRCAYCKEQGPPHLIEKLKKLHENDNR